MGFFNEETNEWECEDECLQKDDNGQYCGETSKYHLFNIDLSLSHFYSYYLLLLFTGHLTSFALLLGGGQNGGGNGCDSSDFNYTLSWISFGLIVTSIILVAIAVFLNEMRYQNKKIRMKNTLKSIRRSQGQL